MGSKCSISIRLQFLYGDIVLHAAPDDPKAVYLVKGDHGVHGDGIADDSDAIQHAVDKVQESDENVKGIVFIPEGRYRINKTILVWPGIRLIGYGAASVFCAREKYSRLSEGSRLHGALRGEAVRKTQPIARAAAVNRWRGLYCPAILSRMQIRNFLFRDK